jgi:histidyl-tRNA synthetase
VQRQSQSCWYGESGQQYRDTRAVQQVAGVILYVSQGHNGHYLQACANQEEAYMTETISSAPARGMRDLLPAEVAIRDWAITAIMRTYEQFGFTRIETPAMENINLLRRGEGGENLQLIFEVLKRGDKLEKELAQPNPAKENLADLGLRFDLTVPLVRFYANNQNNLPNPLKAIQIGSVFRAESPQAGRFRQFTQCDIDVIGMKSEFAEMELVEATSQALLELGFKGFKVRINDRRILSTLAQAFGFEGTQQDRVFIALDKLDKIGIEGVRKELESDLHSPDSIKQMTEFLQKFKTLDLTQLATTSSDLQVSREQLPPTVSDDVWQALVNVITAVRQVAAGAYNIEFDPTLVRGMGYYTGQIFEIACPGYSSSVAGGGRYDKMVGKFSGRDVPAVGFSIGFERIVSILMEQNFKPEQSAQKLALIFEPDRDQLADVLVVANSLRSQGATVCALARKKDMGKQLDALVSQGFNSYAIFKAAQAEPEIKQLKT